MLTDMLTKLNHRAMYARYGHLCTLPNLRRWCNLIAQADARGVAKYHPYKSLGMAIAYAGADTIAVYPNLGGYAC